MRNRWFRLPEDEPPDPPVPDFVPPGLYLLEVEKIEDKVSQWDNEYYLLTCRIVHPAVHDEFRVNFVLSTTLSAMWRFREYLEAVDNKDYSGATVWFDQRDQVGKRFYAELGIGQWNNQQRNTVRKLTPAYPLRGRDY